MIAALTVGLLAGGLTPIAAQAAQTDELDVRFGGSLVGNTAYTTVEGETMRGSLRRVNGAEEQLDAGVKLTATTHGLRFAASQFSLAGPAATSGFVAEIEYTPAAAQADLATVIAAGGNLFARVQGGRLVYGFDAQNAAGAWVQNRQNVALPAAGAKHALSLQYITTDAGSELHLAIDGVDQPTVTSALRAPIHTAAPADFGFGNDVHPAGQNRGLVSTINRVRVASGLTAYDPAAYKLQPARVTTDILNVGLSGGVNAGTYSAAAGDVIDGTLTARSGASVASGVATLAGGAHALDFTASEPFVTAPTLDRAFVAEMEFTPTGAQADMRTLLAVGGNLSVRYRTDGLQYGLSSNSGGSWQNHTLTAATPAPGVPHVLSVAYEPTEAGGATMTVWLDGRELPKLTAPARSTRNPNVASTTTFGNEAPGVAERGFAGTLDRVRFASLDTPFADTAFTFQTRAPETVCEDISDLEPANYIEISPDDCAANLETKASLIRPTTAQLEWQELGLTGFIHFGVNTFYNQEWGHGTEDPARFDPTSDVDVDGWMKTLRDSGHRMAILTVKHHDGFLLYPSRYTDYDVAATPWKDGEGDIVAEFTTAARKYGMEVGLYLSPADSHEELTGRFGNGSPASARTIPTLTEGDDRAGEDLPTFEYDATDYGAYFLNTLYEVLTQYGEIDEVWFDGAAGNTAKQEIFDYAAFYDLIGQLQPNAVVAVGGRDVRWIGNERGVARQNEWAPVAISDPGDGGRISAAIGGQFVETTGTTAQLQQAAATGASHLHWWPSEADMKLTGGWFAHPNDVPKSPTALLGHYLDTVGRNSVMLLNTPPTTAGSFAPSSVASLTGFATERRKAFTLDHALGATVTAPDGTSAPEVTDGDIRSSWTSASKAASALTIDLGQARTVSRVQLAEDVADAGQVVSAFKIHAEVDGAWREVAASGTIGVQRIVTLATPVTAQRFRVEVTSARAPYAIADISLFEQLATDPGRLTDVTLDCTADRAGDGSAARPFASLEQFREAELAPGATVRLRAGQACADSSTPFWGYGTDAAPITVVVEGGTALPSFGERSVTDVFGSLAAQGWVLDLPSAPEPEPTPTPTPTPSATVTPTPEPTPTPSATVSPTPQPTPEPTPTVVPTEGAAPAITGVPARVKFGHKLTIGLTGFTPKSKATVTLVPGNTSLGSVTIDATGEASVKLRMPRVKPGSYAIVVVDSSGASARADVSVARSIPKGKPKR